MSDAGSMSVGMSPRSQEILGEIQRERKMTQKAIVERCLEWFINEEKIIQTIVLKQIPDDYVDSVFDTMSKRYLAKMEAVAEAGGGLIHGVEKSQEPRKSRSKKKSQNQAAVG